MGSSWTEDLVDLVNKEVVLDTAGSLLYLGTLAKVTESGMWLDQADVRDQKEGHVSKELYIIEAAQNGIRVNRQRVFVARATVLSVSALAEVIT